MTLKELKELFKKLQQLKAKKIEIYSNDDLSKNQMDKEFKKIETNIQILEDILARYNKIYNVKAKTLSKYLIEVIESEIPNSSVCCSHHCSGKYVEQEHFYGYHTYFAGNAFMLLEIRTKNSHDVIRLFNRDINENLSNSIDYILGYYQINISELLNNTTKKHIGLIRKACWLAIEETLKTKNKELIQSNEDQKSLINKKIAELQKQAELLETKNNLIKNEETTVFTTKEIEDITKKI